MRRAIQANHQVQPRIGTKFVDAASQQRSVGFEKNGAPGVPKLPCEFADG